MKRIYKTVVGIILTAFFTALVPSGCMLRLEPSVYAQGFLNCIINKDYKGAYERTYPYSATSLAEKDFIKKYTDIFDAMKIKNITVTDGKSEDTADGATYTYQAKYVSESYGTIKQSYTMQLRPYSDTLKVDWNPDLIFPDMDFGDRIVIQTLKGERGEIFTKDGEVLAKNDFADTVMLDLTKAKDFNVFGSELAGKLKMDAADLKKKYDAAVENSDDFLTVKAFPKGTFNDENTKDLTKITGVFIDKSKYTSLRYYPMKQSVAHIVGYTGTPNEKEAKTFTDAGMDPTTLIGRYGLEQTYDEKMRPKDGEAVYIKDEFGSIKATLYKKDAVNGCDLQLSIDSKMQQKAYDLLGENLIKGQSGAAIVLNAATGFVEAAASFPSFDSNIFTFPIDKATYNVLFMDKERDKPLVSRITQGRYPPGSALKPFTIAAALEENVVKPDEEFPKTEKINDNYWTPSFEPWPYTKIKRVDSYSGPMTLSNALIHSDNIFFAWAALRLGEEKMAAYLKKYTLGESMPFDLPLLKSNIINDSSEFTRKLLADMGYGQGEVLVTPMQLAAMYTAFAENGDIKKPVLVTALMREDGINYNTVEQIKSQTLAAGVIKQSTLTTLLPLMVRVVTQGTATGAKVSGIDIAGKTGTAEIGGDKSREISWFVGFWVEPKDNEKRLVLVMVDGPEGEGGPVKLAVAKALLTPPKKAE